jgi:hypothetical protein
MHMFRVGFAVLSVSVATVAAAGDFDGTLPLTCTVKQGFDCLPTKTSCEPVKAEKNISPVVGIDFAKKQVRSPYKNAPLTVLHTTTNKDSLVLQGADLLVGWTTFVDRKTGALTISLADSEGAYVYFGMCKVADKK